MVGKGINRLPTERKNMAVEVTKGRREVDKNGFEIPKGLEKLKEPQVVRKSVWKDLCC